MRTLQWGMNAKPVELDRRDKQAEPQVQEELKPVYCRFMAEAHCGRKRNAGKDLIRAIFGTEAIAEDAAREGALFLR